MSEKIYIIKYKPWSNRWCYFTRIDSNLTYSIYDSNSSKIMKMTLEVAEEYMDRIKEIWEKDTILRPLEADIQILNIKTNKIVDIEQIKANKEFLNREEISIFELIDFD
jgi:hypothetical protein